MNSNHNGAGDLRRHELLAGYVDGEIGPADRAAVESWLQSHPDVANELEIQSRLSRQNSELWSKLSPPLPSADDWNRALNQISQRLVPATPLPKAISRSRMWPTVVATTAAALLIAAGVTFWPNSNEPSIQPSGLVYSVAAASDVVIMDLHGEESILVVGQSPLTETMTVVTYGDVDLLAIASDNEPPTKPNVTPRNANEPIYISPANKVTPVP